MTEPETFGLEVEFGEIAKLRDEREMLIRRFRAAHEHDSSLVGRSSNAMLLAALTGGPVSDRPYDTWDLNRCERTYEAAPPHLRARMTPTLLAFRELVEADAQTRAWLRTSLAKDHQPAALTDEASTSDQGGE